jgi:hypothetical protein
MSDKRTDSRDQGTVAGGKQAKGRENRFDVSTLDNERRGEDTEGRFSSVVEDSRALSPLPPSDHSRPGDKAD